ncbi:MAG: putative toxin-antitoxin system toxin component, PIN family [Planctomycetota bacterium]
MIVVLDTNVVVAGLRSSTGASFRILDMIAAGSVDFALSVPLFLEYEDVLKRPAMRRALGLSVPDVDTVLDVLAAKSRNTKLHFLWRPQLRDPKDEMVLETAANAGARAIVTFNRSDFLPAATAFKLDVIFPKDYLAHTRRASP